MLRPLRLAAAAAALAAAPAALACSVCGCGDPLLGASDPAAIGGILRLQLDTEWLWVSSASEADPAATDRLTQLSYRLNAVYRPLDALSLMVTVPWVQKVMRTKDGASSFEASDEAGLGDVEVAARYTVLRAANFSAQRGQELALSAGTSLPTGSYLATDAAGSRVDMHGQVGTGGFGPFAGIHYRVEQGDLAAFASLSGRVRTEASLGGGDAYRYGSSLVWSLHAQLRPAPVVALDLGLDGRSAAADTAKAAGGPSETVPNTGGTVWSVAPGVYFNAAQGFWLFLRAQVPVYKQLHGVQDVGPTITTGLQLEAM